MAFTEKSIYRQAVSDTTETLYTVPASTTTIIKDIHICNNSATACWVSLWLVSNKGSASDENVMFYQWNVPANDFVHWSGYQILDTAGDTIQAQSETADQVTAIISGAEL
jgi:hypothetical protein